MVINIETMK